jgi:hypothetical protein
VVRALEKRPEGRFASAAEFLAALRAAVGSGMAVAAPEWDAPAIAVHVAVGQDAADPDDEALAAQAVVLEAIEQALQSAGFSFPLATASAVLAARLLPDDPAQAREQRAQALALAGGLPELARRACGQSSIQVRVCVHADLARVRATPQGPTVVGGPICRTDSWVVASRGDLHATAAAEQGIASRR